MNFVKFHIPLPPISQSPKINHQDTIMLLGSCFVEQMSVRLAEQKFKICSNPHGILFNPFSILHSLHSYIQKKEIDPNSLFQMNEVWNHWDFHSRFSGTDHQETVSQMNASIHKASEFLKQADWLIITLGSAFQYFYVENKKEEIPVANCHKANNNFFKKRMLGIEEMIKEFEITFQSIRQFNPKLKIIFTVSPVRYIREGLIENNHSKARLLELVHYVVQENSNCFYFPAYEIIIDVLRDYRFYDTDMVHPNQQAADYVWDQFIQGFFTVPAQCLLAELKELNIAFKHQPRFPFTPAHQSFKLTLSQKIKSLTERFPYLNFESEKAYLRT